MSKKEDYPPEGCELTQSADSNPFGGQGEMPPGMKHVTSEGTGASPTDKFLYG